MKRRSNYLGTYGLKHVFNRGLCNASYWRGYYIWIYNTFKLDNICCFSQISLPFRAVHTLIHDEKKKINWHQIILFGLQNKIEHALTLKTFKKNNFEFPSRSTICHLSPLTDSRLIAPWRISPSFQKSLSILFSRKKKKTKTKTTDVQTERRDVRLELSCIVSHHRSRRYIQKKGLTSHLFIFRTFAMK